MNYEKVRNTKNTKYELRKSTKYENEIQIRNFAFKDKPN